MAVTPSSARCGILRATSRNVPAFCRQVRREERADVQLVDDEVVKLRRDVAGLVPREVGLADDAVAGKRRLQLARVRIALRALAAVADDVEHVAVAVAHAGDETAPVAALVAREQAGVVALAVVEVADHMHRSRVRRPDAKGRAVGDQVRTHRGAGVDVVERGGHRSNLLAFAGGSAGLAGRIDLLLGLDGPQRRRRRGVALYAAGLPTAMGLPSRDQALRRKERQTTVRGREPMTRSF